MSPALTGRFFTTSTTWEADSLESTTKIGFKCFVKGLQNKAYIFKLDNFVLISFQITVLITVYNHNSHLCDENFGWESSLQDPFTIWVGDNMFIGKKSKQYFHWKEKKAPLK